MTDLIGFREMVPRNGLLSLVLFSREMDFWRSSSSRNRCIVGSGRHLIEIENLMLVLIQLIRVVLFSKQLTLSHDWRAIALMS
mmetsp:Transcript_24854/g.35576  ORF Transcript_24854/g.35576 Transcript_24854/m.35576 type:complete len:83 (+) Transcript_24854:849-1097(+)